MTHTNEDFQSPMFEPTLFRSDLEGVLLETHFPPDMLLRATAFRRSLIMTGLTRFNNGGAWRRPVNVQRVILVMGQVENDISLRLGERSIRSNLALLKAVCQSHADAYIVYKPHPEVWAQMQSQGQSTKDLQLWCDECVPDVPLAQLLPKVNEVHVMTSLAGFEALMRGKKVFCYGQAFYAGWGLTSDMVPMPSRPRQLSVDELVAGALFSFPRYMGRHARQVKMAEPAMPMLPPVTNWRTAARSLSARTRA
jgi:capsular polysaccharide export protein